MNEIVIQQLLHGYRKGHQLLAGSVRLSGDAADLLARLSDLSGALPPDSRLPPYLTLYPVPGSGHYALARTWLDDSAPRSGCVLTHTLLVPVEEWKQSRNPEAFASLLAEPSAEKDEARFRTPLELPRRLAEGTPSRRRLSAPVATDFVVRYFGEGVRPVVWFDCEAPEDVLWALVCRLWPALRGSFTSCTFCLQPRSSADRPFDLMFAPGSSYPRFHGVPREGILRPASPAPAPSAPPPEPWTDELAGFIFGPADRTRLGPDMEAFAPLLGEDPPGIRNLFLVRELRARLSASPTAGVGLLDVLESVAPGEAEAETYKSEAVRDALKACVAAPPEDSLKCLFLIGERLLRPAYRTVAAPVASSVARSVAAIVPGYVREALAAPGPRARPDEPVSPYYHGLLNGLVKLASSSPESLLALREFPELAALLVPRSGPVALGYLRGAKGAGEEAVVSLVQWIAPVSAAAERRELRNVLLPEVERDDEASLAEALLAGIPDEDVGWALETLYRSTNGFRSPRVREVASEELARKYPSPVREWARASPGWSTESATVVAASFPDGEEGLCELLAAAIPDGVRRAEIAASFLEHCTRGRFPAWLRDHARRNCDFLVPLLAAGKRMPPNVVQAITRVLAEVHELPMAGTAELLPLVAEAGSLSFFQDLADRSLCSAIRGYVGGGIEWPACLSWFSTDWGRRWLESASARELGESLRAEPHNGLARERAWAWVAGAPEPLYRRRPGVLAQVVGRLLSGLPGAWTPAMAEAWVAVLSRAKTEANSSTHLQLCADALAYGFDHVTLPLGPVVAEAFQTVHEGVSASTTPAEAASLFGFFDWDKAKQLRKRLIEAFLGSSWRPGDLAIAAGGETLLRKIFKRLRRRWKGEQYIDSMCQDLNSRTDAPAVRAREILVSLVRDPDFYEPWD